MVINMIQIILKVLHTNFVIKNIKKDNCINDIINVNKVNLKLFNYFRVEKSISFSLVVKRNLKIIKNTNDFYTINNEVWAQLNSTAILNNPFCCFEVVKIKEEIYFINFENSELKINYLNINPDNDLFVVREINFVS